MPGCYSRCVEQMSHELGGNREAACRACRGACFQETGMTPEALDKAGQEPSVDLIPHARRVSQMAEEQGGEGDGGSYLASGSFLAQKDSDQLLSAFSGSYAAENGGEGKRCLRVVKMLEPGAFQTSTGPWIVSAADCESLEANFLTWPRRVSFQTDHSMALDDRKGIVLAVKYRAENQTAYGLVEILGAENVEKVNDGRIKEVSVGVYRYPAPRRCAIFELSAVVAGAVPSAGFQANAGKEGLSMPHTGGNPTPSPAPAGNPTQNPNPVQVADENVQVPMSLIGRFFASMFGGQTQATQLAQVPAPTTTPAAPAPNAELETLKAAVATQAKQLEALVQANAKLEQEKILARFQEAGQVPPACQEALGKHLATLNAEQKVSLCEFLGQLPTLASIGSTHSRPATPESEGEFREYYRATHGKYPDANPELSGVVLPPGRTGATNTNGKEE